MESIGTTSSNFIDQVYTNKVLKQEAQNIIQAQDQVFAKYNPKQLTGLKQNRSFSVSNSQLDFKHSIVARFIDMKFVAGHKRIPIPNHNTVLYGHFNNIVYKLAYGLTSDVKKLIAQEHNIQL